MSGWQASLGAIVQPDGSVTFRVWAPGHERVELLIEGRPAADMARDGDYRVIRTFSAAPNSRYRFRVDGGLPVPDPCSRSQPEGVHGASEVVDPGAFRWSDHAFEPPAMSELVVYEAHIGTLTRAGTFDAAIPELPRLRTLGVTAIELMPVAGFPGGRNWGYDGVCAFAPAASYGPPESMRRFVDAAHAHGLAVILDVVYNHFGPDGNYAAFFSPYYLTAAHHTPWGDAVNFDQPGNEGVRAFVIENLLAWHHEYHVDGFRFDATHTIHDSSRRHILAEAGEVLEANKRGGRRPILIAETDENDVRYLQPYKRGGYGMDAVWADDFHHVVRNLLHPEREGYLRSYEGTLAELARTIEQGFLYEGQADPVTGQPRGTRARGEAWSKFVYFLQNHDQVGNRAFGERLHHTAPLDLVRTVTTLLLLLPQTPLLFQGQEFFASSPFLFFSDHQLPLGESVTEGRRREFAAFAAFRDPASRSLIPDPQAEDTFERSKLDAGEIGKTAGAQAAIRFHSELLWLRRNDPVLTAIRLDRSPLATQVWGQTFAVTMATGEGRRTIYVNFGDQPETLGEAGPGRVLFSSEDAAFGGRGAIAAVNNGTVTVPERSATFVAWE